MKYLLPCKCGQSVEIEPGQAGQTVVCGCGENLLVPSMLQIKMLPMAPEKTTAFVGKTHAPYGAKFAILMTLISSVACLALSIPIGWIAHYLGFDGNLVFRIVCGLGVALLLTMPVIAVRALIRSDDTNILSRASVILGIVLLCVAVPLAFHLWVWTPDPTHALIKRTQFSFGSNQKMLYQDSTQIPWEEHYILWMTDEVIDQMTPMQLHSYFLTLEEPMFSHNFRENYDAVWKTYRIWVTVNIILFILAFSSIVVSFFMPKRNVVVTGWSGSEW